MTDPGTAALSLPIYRHEAEIVAAVRDNSVVVLEGPTGSGKTTQLPRILLRAGLVEGMIGITQPRRIAAVSVAHRIAVEERVELGREVGYAIRFDDLTSPATRLKIMTDGILLQEVRSDPDLSAYSVLVIDEAHERSLNIDFCLGLLAELIPRRPDLRVVISSATIQPETFQAFFSSVSPSVPLVSVQSRTHPVKAEYKPVSGGSGDLPDAVAKEVMGIHRRREPGHILVFLTGEGMIHQTARAIEQLRPGRGLVVLPLYGRLPREEQERVFAEFEQRRKVVLATNIAETSITIPDVCFVIDTGLAKIPRFNPATGISSIREEPVSMASSEQRAGRAGRTAPGTVVRLYSRAQHANKKAYTEEEIRRLDLSEVVLRLIDLGVRAVERFPFPTPPPRKKLDAAIETLTAMNAIDEARELTEIGRRMVPFPLSPALARMVVEAADRYPRSVDEVLVAGAFLSGKPPFLFPLDEEEAARDAQVAFRHPLGDTPTAIKTYRAFCRAKDRAEFCEASYLDLDVMSFIESAHQQLADIAREHGIDVQGGGSPDEIVRCVAAGFADKLLRRRRGGQYETAGGEPVAIHPGSALFGTRHPFLVACEIVISSRTFARHVSVVRPDWIAEINPQTARLWKVGRRGRRRTEAFEPAPDVVEVGGVRLKVNKQKKKLFVEVSGADVERLKRADRSELDEAVLKWPARIVTDAGVFASGVRLGRLLAMLPHLPLPEPGATLPRDVPEGELLTVDDDWPTIERYLERVLEPTQSASGKRPGWLALVANGLGEFWFEVLHDYSNALQTTLISLVDLRRVVPPDHLAQERLSRVEEALRERDRMLNGTR